MKAKRISTMFISFMVFISCLFNINTSAMIFDESLSSDENNTTAINEYSSTYEKIYQQTIDRYSNDPEFARHLKADKESAIDNLKQVVESKFRLLEFQNKFSTDNLSIARTPINYTIPMYYIPQYYRWSCGTASTLQTLDGRGYLGNVPGSTNAAKEIYMLDWLKATYLDDPYANESVYVYQVRALLNQYLGNNTFYEILGLDMTEADFASFYTCSSIFSGDNAPILHARTGSLSYYGPSNNITHYINIRGFYGEYGSPATSFHLMDCHYDYTYGGPHTENRSSVYSTINTSGRYLITAA